MINKVTLVGNLGKDPEVRHLENGSVVAKLAVATNENYRDKNDQWQTLTEWHTVVVWRRLAEVAERNLKKGNMVYIEGKLTHRKWQDKDGNDRYNTEVVANVLRSLEKREPSGNPNYPNNAIPDANKTNVVKEPEGPAKTVEPTDEDDLPF